MTAFIGERVSTLEKRIRNVTDQPCQSTTLRCFNLHFAVYSAVFYDSIIVCEDDSEVWYAF